MFSYFAAKKPAVESLPDIAPPRTITPIPVAAPLNLFKPSAVTSTVDPFWEPKDVTNGTTTDPANKPKLYQPFYSANGEASPVGTLKRPDNNAARLAKMFGGASTVPPPAKVQAVDDVALAAAQVKAEVEKALLVANIQAEKERALLDTSIRAVKDVQLAPSSVIVEEVGPVAPAVVIKKGWFGNTLVETVEVAVPAVEAQAMARSSSAALLNTTDTLAVPVTPTEPVVKKGWFGRTIVETPSVVATSQPEIMRLMVPALLPTTTIPITANVLAEITTPLAAPARRGWFSTNVKSSESAVVMTEDRSPTSTVLSSVAMSVEIKADQPPIAQTGWFSRSTKVAIEAPAVREEDVTSTVSVRSPVLDLGPFTQTQKDLNSSTSALPDANVPPIAELALDTSVKAVETAQSPPTASDDYLSPNHVPVSMMVTSPPATSSDVQSFQNRLLQLQKQQQIVQPLRSPRLFSGSSLATLTLPVTPQTSVLDSGGLGVAETKRSMLVSRIVMSNGKRIVTDASVPDPQPLGISPTAADTSTLVIPEQAVSTKKELFGLFSRAASKVEQVGPAGAVEQNSVNNANSNITDVPPLEDKSFLIHSARSSVSSNNSSTFSAFSGYSRSSTTSNMFQSETGPSVLVESKILLIRRQSDRMATEREKMEMERMRMLEEEEAFEREELELREKEQQMAKSMKAIREEQAAERALQEERARGLEEARNLAEQRVTEEAIRIAIEEAARMESERFSAEQRRKVEEVERRRRKEEFQAKEEEEERAMAEAQRNVDADRREEGRRRTAEEERARQDSAEAERRSTHDLEERRAAEAESLQLKQTISGPLTSATVVDSDDADSVDQFVVRSQADIQAESDYEYDLRDESEYEDEYASQDEDISLPDDKQSASTAERENPATLQQKDEPDRGVEERQLQKEETEGARRVPVDKARRDSMEEERSREATRLQQVMAEEIHQDEERIRQVSMEEDNARRESMDKATRELMEEERRQEAVRLQQMMEEGIRQEADRQERVQKRKEEADALQQRNVAEKVKRLQEEQNEENRVQQRIPEDKDRQAKADERVRQQVSVENEAAELNRQQEDGVQYQQTQDEEDGRREEEERLERIARRRAKDQRRQMEIEEERERQRGMTTRSSMTPRGPMTRSPMLLRGSRVPVQPFQRPSPQQRREPVPVPMNDEDENSDEEAKTPAQKIARAERDIAKAFAKLASDKASETSGSVRAPSVISQASRPPGRANTATGLSPRPQLRPVMSQRSARANTARPTIPGGLPGGPRLRGGNGLPSRRVPI